MLRKEHLLRHLELRQLICNPSLQLPPTQLLSRLEHNSDAHLLTIHLVGDGEADGFRNGWVAREDVVELNRGDFLAAFVNEFLLTG